MSRERTTIRPSLRAAALAGAALLLPALAAPALAASPAPAAPAAAATSLTGGLRRAPAPKQVQLLHRDAPLPRLGTALRRRATDGTSSSVVSDITGPARSTWQVTYSTSFSAPAKAAFQQAVNIWAAVVQSSVPIKVNASLAALPPGVLGSAGASGLYGGPGIGDEMSYYPSALADALAHRDVEPGVNNGISGPDIDAQFTSDSTGIYYGTDGRPPAGYVDFESVVLHELGHGLGFSGLLDYDTATGTGGLCCGADAPDIYDRKTVDGAGRALLSYANGSTALGSALTSGQVRWAGAKGTAALSGVRPRLYAPNPWQDGSSYAHLDEASFPRGNPNSLMTPSISAQEVIHDPGNVTVGIFKDIGWVADRPDVLAPTATITAAPAALSRSTTASFTFKATDDSGGPFTYHCRLDGVWSSCTSPRTYTGLAQGSHAFAMTATDLAGNNSALQQRSWRVDSIAPAVSTAAVPASSRADTVSLSYSATDTGGTGVTTYDVRYRQAPWYSGFGAYVYPAVSPRDWQGITALSVSLPATRGYTYCLSARAHDLAGNASLWSAERCTTRVLDDAPLVASSGWTRGTGTAYYAGTVTSTRSSAVTLTRASLQARRIWLVATTCPTCGSVAVSWNGVLLGNVSLVSSTTAYQRFFYLGDRGSVQSGTLTVRTLKAADTRIDGVATTR